jgi:hypothetical protein
MQVLAGFIDCDGYLDKESSYELVQSKAHEHLFDDIREIAQSLGFRMSKTACIKTCKYKGEVKKCPAVRGTIYGDKRLADIPVRILYKKIVKEKLARHDLYRFDLKPVIDSETTISNEIEQLNIDDKSVKDYPLDNEIICIFQDVALDNKISH